MLIQPGLFVIGGGGREHALVWHLARTCPERPLFCAPGNPGIAHLATCIPIATTDLGALADAAASLDVALTIVGPEVPLVAGVVDIFYARGLPIIGPTAAAARIEGSKVYAKRLMERAQVPTAAYAVFSEPASALAHLRTCTGPLVVKADGLAAGKGVVLCDDPGAAERIIADMMVDHRFGDAGRTVVVEERLEGEEVSVLALTDGETVIPLAPAQDHKRVRDGDAGPNTGGMGAYSPAPVFTPEVERHVMDDILVPVVRGLAAEGIVYRGILYAGLMLERGRAKVLEFNVRFGDPECQPLMLRLRSDLVDLMERTVEGRLRGARVEWDPRAAVCVVLAAGGYPGEIEKGTPISGLDRLRDWTNGVVFHAGTRRVDGTVVTAGGRVLGVTGLGADIGAAIAETYGAVRQITFENMHYRTDIGRRALARRGL